jgi:LmbE family N-acetylglucosaminyl deacetylase
MMRIVLVAAAVMATIVSPAVDAGVQQRGRPPRPQLALDAHTRLLVVAPHPDDETLGAGGAIQRVHALGGSVHVIYLTDGDGYPEGVQTENRIENPAAADYRGYGRRRRREARAALGTLGLPGDAHTFLSFPDRGLCLLTRTYWSDRRSAYRSPYTRLDRPPKSELLVPETEYRGEDLTQELAAVIGDFRPTMILVPRAEDQHADHCASWFFVSDALEDVERVHPEYHTDVVTYIVHWNTWPFEDESRRLAPPPGLRGGISGWMELTLTPAELQKKRAAIQAYQTQEKAMSWFLDGFVRANEVFSRPAPPHVVLPSKRNLCCDR